MASQYEQGPEAKAVGEGLQLHEMLRRERGLNKRQASSQAFDRSMADVTQAHALDRLVKGEELKEQFAQKEAERSAPFLQQLIGGNPNVAKAFGFTEPGQPEIVRQGAMAEPEAAGIPAPTVTPQMPRRPSMQEATGLSRAVPGIAQALLQKSMDPNAGFTLAPGQIRFNAMGQEIARGGPMDIGMTLEEAQAVKKRMEEQDPTNVGRVQLQSHEKGGWTVSLASQTPLTPPDPLKEGYSARIKAGMDPKAALDWYVQQSAAMAGQKALQINLNTPPTEAVIQSDEKTNVSVNAFRRLRDLNNVAPALVREFLTWKGSAADLYSKLNRIPGMQYMVGPQGLNQQEFLQRYEEWAADLGRIRESSFDAGGKQLTPFEDKIVTMTRPLKTDSPEAYMAKMNWMGSYVEAQEAYRAWSRVTPRIAQTPEAKETAWAQAKQKAGIDLSNETDYRRFMSPDDRVRDRVRN